MRYALLVLIALTACATCASGGTWTITNLHLAETTRSVICAATENQQAGYTMVGGAYHAGMWSGTAESWVDLHFLLPASEYLSSTADSVYTSGDRICVAGSALLNTNGYRVHAILWTYVVPEPSSVLTLLCGIGAMGGVILRKRK